MSLVQAIDQAVEFVRAHPDRMTRAEVDEFHRLAEQAYILAYRAGLVDALPKVPEMKPQLESQDPPLPPVQFESKLNLPGDWDLVWPDDGNPLPPCCPVAQDVPATFERVFLPCASPRWFADMSALRALADAESGEQPKELQTPEAVWLGNRRMRIGNEPPFTISQQYAVVLQGLVDLRAADIKQLERYGGGAKS